MAKKEKKPGVLILSYTFRLYPTKEQEKELFGLFKIQREIYTYLLNAWRRLHIGGTRHKPAQMEDAKWIEELEKSDKRIQRWEDKENVKEWKLKLSKWTNSKVVEKWIKNGREPKDRPNGHPGDPPYKNINKATNFDLTGLLTQRKKKNTDWYILNANTGNNMAIRAVLACESQLNAFWEKGGKGRMYPKHKKDDELPSILFSKSSTQNNLFVMKDIVTPEYNHVKLPASRELSKSSALRKVFKFYQHRPFPSGHKIKTARIIVKEGKYDIIFTIEVADKDQFLLPKTNKTVGVDLGGRYVVFTSDGKKYSNLRFGKKIENQIKVLQQRLARQKGGKVKGEWITSSNGYKATQAKIIKFNAKVARLRVHYAYEIINDLIRRYDVIKLENFLISELISDKDQREYKKNKGETIHNKKEANKNKQLLDGALGDFRTRLEQSAIKAGKEIQWVNAAYTSQTCPECNCISKENRINGSEEFKCIECEYTAHADLVGALNILKGKPEFKRTLKDAKKEKEKKRKLTQGTSESPIDL